MLKTDLLYYHRNLFHSKISKSILNKSDDHFQQQMRLQQLDSYISANNNYNSCKLEISDYSPGI